MTDLPQFDLALVEAVANVGLGIGYFIFLQMKFDRRNYNPTAVMQVFKTTKLEDLIKTIS